MKRLWFDRLLFFTCGVIAATTRFVVSAEAQQAGTSTAAQTQKVGEAVDADDPKFAGHFSGRVMGPDGRPKSEAKVFLVPSRSVGADFGPVRAEIGADGRFEFDAVDMTYVDFDGLRSRRQGLLVVTAEGCAPDWMTTWGRNHSGFKSHFDPVKGAELELQLVADDVPLHGRFLDPDGRPLSGARVLLTNLMIPRNRDLDAHLDRESKASIFNSTDYEREFYQPQWPGLVVEARTDADGRFTMSGLGRDRLATLTVSAPTVVDTSLTVMTRDRPDIGTRRGQDGKPMHVIHGSGFTVKLKPGLTIKGQVIDRDTRQPIAGMWLGPIQNPISGVSASLYPWISDQNGRFTITGVDPIRLQIKRDDSRRVVMAVSPPGFLYQTAGAVFDADSELLIECPRGIPFRLKVVDEQGSPVDAEVVYSAVQPNPHTIRRIPHDERQWPNASAARKAAGTYEGFVQPGPGAVLVKTKRDLKFGSAHVSPKAFFAPGRTDWTNQERISTYGTEDHLMTDRGWEDQRDYAAIVLINPSPDSGPLELTATVVPDRPRQVSLIDPDGKIVDGAWIQYPSFWESLYRTGTFSLTRLHPDRVDRITFLKDDRKLIGFLAARGDREEPYTVRMQPWSTVTGRVVDENGKPVDVSLAMYDSSVVTSDDSALGRLVGGGKTDPQGRFHIDKLIPGEHYHAEMYWGYVLSGVAFKDVVLQPGEVRDLGEIRFRRPVVETK